MANVHFIAGLGNPGEEYARTRHNAGFMAVEMFAQRHSLAWQEDRRNNCRVARGEVGDRRVMLCEPLTFMNASGEAIGPLVRYYGIEPVQVLVAVDDADLRFGEIRLRANGSSGGHHGLESIESHLGTREYPRLRIGLGRKIPGVREITGHVLGRFGTDEQALLKQVLERATDQMACWLVNGVQSAMNKFNGTIVDPAQEKKS